MKRSTALILVKLFAGLSLFTGIIAVIFFIFLFVNPQHTQNKPTPTISVTPTETSQTEGQFCGGIAAIQCTDGYVCKIEGNYPDAGGTCIKDNN